MTVARQGNTTAAGLGYAHQRDRKRALAAMPDGTPCQLCGQPMYHDKTRNWDGRVLHYDHVIARALGGVRGPMRLTHATCNIRAGSVVARQVRRGRPGRAPARRGRYTRW